MYTVYKITNLINNKYYIGVHQTDIPNDNYMGSGPAIKAAILKYGKENFEKNILHTFDTEILAYAKEKEILTGVWQLEECYNMTEGGIGGWSHVDSSGTNNCMKRSHIVEKVKSTSLKNGSYFTDKKIKSSIENAKKGSKARTGMKDSDEVKKTRNASVKKALSNETTRQKLIESIRALRCVPYTLIDPYGIIYNTDVISQLCDELSIPLSTVTTHADGREIKRGKLKGWTIFKKGGNN